MARLAKDGSTRGQRSGVEFVGKAPSKTLIIPAKELVQVIAKVCYILCIYRVLGKTGSNSSSNSATILLVFSLKN